MQQPLSARAYLKEAFEYLEARSVRRDQIDWPALRREVEAVACDAQDPAETYPAIRLALERLGDRHSFFSTPEQVQRNQAGLVMSTGLTAVYPEGFVVIVCPDSAAAAAGVKQGDRIETLNGCPLAQLDEPAVRAAMREPEVTLTLGRAPASTIALHASAHPPAPDPNGRRLARGFAQEVAYLELPAMTGNTEMVARYAAATQQLIRDLNQPPARGWIVDLRRNGGGNMWPMLAGVGPLLGEGKLGSFVFRQGKTSWSYRDGQALLEDRVLAAVDPPYPPLSPAVPVAVLTSRLTASSGEMVVLAFRGRPSTRSFGEATRGVPTANEQQWLPDGARIFLTVALGADRAGKCYDGPITPDVPMPANWARLGADGDPVIRAATVWIREPSAGDPQHV